MCSNVEQVIGLNFLINQHVQSMEMCSLLHSMKVTPEAKMAQMLNKSLAFAPFPKTMCLFTMLGCDFAATIWS